MRVIGQSNRGLLAAGFGVLLLASAVGWLNSKNQEGDGTPSSYSNLRRGGKAAFLLLKQSGYEVEHWERSPTELPKDAAGTLLIIAEPDSYPQEEEKNAITRFLVNGGHILVAGAYPAWFVPRSGASSGEPRVGYASCQPVACSHLTRGGPITQDRWLYWNHNDDSQLVHYIDSKGEPVVVSYGLGKGEVIWWASAVPLINSGIQERGNLDLLLNSIGAIRHVLWDEYYHSYHETETLHGSTAALKWAGVQALILALLVVLTFSRRSGPTVSLVHRSRLSPFEFVETLGSVFRRAGKTQVAVEIAYTRFRQVAARRLGLRGNATAPEILDSMRQRGLSISPEMDSSIRAVEDAIADPGLSETSAMYDVRWLNCASTLLESTKREGKE
jgi:hypothetical protein